MPGATRPAFAPALLSPRHWPAWLGLAVVKAACVALFFMHLKWETRVLRAIVVAPMCLPILYSLVLITEGIWRRLGT